MPELDEAQATFTAARKAEKSKQTELIQTRESIKRLRREAERLQRKQTSAAAPDPQLLEVSQRLSQAETERKGLEVELAQAIQLTKQSVLDFSFFTDPREAVERLGDDTPIAMMPLRLETRFKLVDGAGGPQQMLWVRVFPDDILVDTFQDEISDNEYNNVATYWTHRYRAGGDRGGLLAAWKALVKSYGAGRSQWLLSQLAPTTDNEPTAVDGEHILVVRPETPVLEAEQAPIAAFWSQVWSSAGVSRDAAFADLEAAVGFDRAAEIEAELAPVNLHDSAVKPEEAITPRVVFLDLPPREELPLSQDDWTRPARTWLLPERLVLLGFRLGQPTLEVVGNAIPPELQVGPDPGAREDQQFRADGDELEVPEAARWTVDFQSAVAQGMGFEVNLTSLNRPAEFDRLFVVGVRVSSDAAEGAEEFSELIRHHQASRRGCELLPQGSPTNNTEESTAGYSWWEDAEKSYKHLFEGPLATGQSWKDRPDGAWLDGLLGLPDEPFKNSVNYYGADQAEARAMNRALWPGTLGYFMEQMMAPVFSAETVRSTKSYLERFVTGRGTLPVIRVGRQPYGFIPATVWTRMQWWKDASYSVPAAKTGLPSPDFLQELHQLFQPADAIWDMFAKKVPRVFEPGNDSQQTLLDVLGLHPTSAEFYQRYSQSFTQHYNDLGFATTDVAGPMTEAAADYAARGMQALSIFGYQPAADANLPEVFKKMFLQTANLLHGVLVQDPLSNTERLASNREDGLNYIEWLEQAARTNHDTLRKQEGFTTGIPTSLLYLMLHHALDLGYVGASFDLKHVALNSSAAEVSKARQEPKFIGVTPKSGKSQYVDLYQPNEAVTGDPSMAVGEFIAMALTQKVPKLNQQLDALKILAGASSASLERCLVEHIDCLSYRVDAWRVGMHAVQLASMRRDFGEGFQKSGLLLGAFGWVENLRPKSTAPTAVTLDPELAAVFGEDLHRDPSNFGHIHAPSLDQAVTAAILRNGHLANATPEAPDRLAVDLSSRRVRLALQVVDGIRNGHSLGALLGYRLERGLHDEPGLFLDRLIYDLRRLFPLAGNRNVTTQVATDVAITKLEARNVVDGMAFVEHLQANKTFSYPYGLTSLPPLSDFAGPGLPPATEIGALIDAHVAQMLSVGDAVADLQIAEGVYQVVRGNFDRASGALEAFSKGGHAPEPEVIQTQRSGKTLTHRVTLQLQGGLSVDDPTLSSPRAQGEPAIAAWVASQLPDMAAVFARVSWQDPQLGLRELTPSMADLGLDAVSFFYRVDAGGAENMAGLDDLLIDFAERQSPAPGHDAEFSLEYLLSAAPGFSAFEIAPMVRALRGYLLSARPLRPTDLSLQNEASKAEDLVLLPRPDKAAKVRDGLQLTSAAVGALVTSIEGAVGDGVTDDAARIAARTNIDGWIDSFAEALRPVHLFGLEAAGLATAVVARRTPFLSLRKQLDDLVSRWQNKQSEYDGVQAELAALPPTATDDEKRTLLIRAGRIVSTTVIAPLPATVPLLAAQVAGFRATLDTEVSKLVALRDTSKTLGAILNGAHALLPAIASIDLEPFDLSQIDAAVLALARDLQSQLAAVAENVQSRLQVATSAILSAQDATASKAQSKIEEAARAVLGKAFIVLPEFVVEAQRGLEWDNVWATQDQLLTHLGPEPSLIAEDWLHGVAQVREQLRHLEAASLFAEAVPVTGSMDLRLLQFPHRPGAVWVGAEFPTVMADGEPFVLDEDKLLLSAIFGAGAEVDTAQPAKRYCGLLLDEWIEVIPGKKENTGLAFHYDRPNSEAPQGILLVTPPDETGAWSWKDIVDAMHETLDMAKIRAVEPKHFEETALAPVVPTVMSMVTMLPLTPMLNFSFVNGLATVLEAADE